MKQAVPIALLAVSLFLLALTRPLAAAEEGTGTALQPMLVTPEILESRLAEVESAADLPDETRTKLIQLYRKALSNLAEAKTNGERAAAFEEATRTAPAQTQQMREAIETTKRTDPLETLDVGITTLLEQLEQRLQKQQADLSAGDARRADLERRLTYQQSRPAAISQRLAEAKQQQEEVRGRIQGLRPTSRRARPGPGQALGPGDQIHGAQHRDQGARPGAP